MKQKGTLETIGGRWAGRGGQEGLRHRLKVVVGVMLVGAKRWRMVGTLPMSEGSYLMAGRREAGEGPAARLPAVVAQGVKSDMPVPGAGGRGGTAAGWSVPEAAEEAPPVELFPRARP